MSDVNLICADARRIPLADESVQCIVTSPPYWGLRKYAGEQELVWDSGTGIRACAWNHEWAEETLDKSKPGTKNSGLTNGGNSQNVSNRFVATHGTCRRCGA